MRNGNSVLTRLLVVTLVAAGIVWAAQTQTVSIPQGPSFVVTAVIVPGTGGAEVLSTGEMWDDDVELSITFDPGGTVRVNGTPAGLYVGANQHRVEVSGRQVGNQWFADAVVVDETTQTEIVRVEGEAMAKQPARAKVTADTVLSLTAS